MHAVKYEYINFDDYLAGERDVDVRSEYVDGQIYAMSGASAAHNIIAGELFAAIHSRTEPPCQPFMSDMKVVIRHNGKNFAYYPDIMVACDKNNADNYTRNNPILIIEVLSPSTQRTDLGEKFVNYTQIPTFREYVIVSQDTPHLQIFRRRNNWKPEYFYAGDTFTLESVGLEMAVETVYRRVRKEVGLD